MKMYLSAYAFVLIAAAQLALALPSESSSQAPSSYVRTCDACQATRNHLVCSCTNQYGTKTRSDLDLNNCIGNRYGKIQWQKK